MIGTKTNKFYTFRDLFATKKDIGIKTKNSGTYKNKNDI
jgi:hypothetical protein